MLINVHHLFELHNLCVPVDPEDAQSRERSIAMTASTYARVDDALILDAKLMDMPRSTLELFLSHDLGGTRVCQSLTLQERALASRCPLQSADRGFHPAKVPHLPGKPGRQGTMALPKRDTTLPQ